MNIQAFSIYGYMKFLFREIEALTALMKYLCKNRSTDGTA